MKCPRCNRDDPDAGRFCRHCGAAIDVAPASTSTSPAVYTPRHLAAKILTSRRVLEGERKLVTVLFADIKASMELLVDRDPEDARAVLDPVLELMMEAVHHYEGTVNQVMGDGIMALFGAPLAHEDHAVRACLAALRMQERMRRYADEIGQVRDIPLGIRIGLNSGAVVVRSIGNDLHMDYTAVGQTTHLAARMEQIADAGAIFATAETARLAEGYVNVASLGVRSIRGLDEPMEVYAVVGAGAAQSRLDVAAARGLTDFVGRDTEIAALRLAMQAAADGRGQVVGVVGDPGVGKSRLFREVTHAERLPGWLVLKTGAASYGKATAYRPVIDLLRAYFDLPGHADAADSRERITAKIAALRGDVASMVHGLLALFELPVDDPAWQALDPRQRRQETIGAIVRVLLRQSEIHPLCLVFEDLHWIDSETQAVLDTLVEAVPTARMLLLVNYRPEYRHGWGGKSYYSQLRVDPLPRRSAEDLLGLLLGGDPGLAAVKRLLVEHTEGNPFFLEESVRMLVEDGVFVGTRGRHRLAKPVETIRVPPTVQAVLAARIDRLRPEDKRLLQCASVIGETVPLDLLAAVTDLTAPELREGLARLRAAEFLGDANAFPEPEHVFRHGLTRQVTYGTLLRDHRRALHARIVDAVELVYTGRLGEHVERLAHHALAAERWDRAVGYARDAGAKALARSAYRGAIAHFEHALGALGHLPDDRARSEAAIDIRFELRTALSPLAEHERIAQHLRTAESVAVQLGDKPRLARVSAYLADYFRQIGAHDRAIAAGERAQAIASVLGDVALEIAANTYLGHACQNTGQYRRAMALFRRTAELAGDHLVGGRVALPFVSSVQSRIWLASCLHELGDFAEAISVAESAIDIAETARHDASLATACSVLGHVYLRMGEPRTAVPFLERGYTLSQTAGLNIWLPTAEGWLGLAYGMLGRLEEGARLVSSAVDRERAMRRLAHHATRLAALAECYLWLGQTDDAEATVVQALDFACRQGERGNEAHALRVLGTIAARSTSSKTMDAETAFGNGIRLADELEMRPVSALCHAGLGAVLHRSGHAAEASHHLRTAVTLVEAMRAPALLEHAQRDARPG
jgi:class 3 adenylate cyclase